MSAHDVVSQHDDGRASVVECRCGRTFDGPNLVAALAEQEKHYRLEDARAALRGDKEGTAQ